MPSEYAAAGKKIEALRAELEELVTEYIRARAAEISGVPCGVLRHMLEARSTGYCLCKALKNIANESDGI